MCILHAERARDIAFANSSMLSSNNDQSKGLSNYGDESNPKPRKPYTITKQREKWTDEEHEKFLEALKLYGRGWRNIEEHVGTKTAIQIRSHAQKFFSKVVRESASNGKESPIEIPPPRPKRRPSHPYPRKLTIVPTKSILSVQKGDRHSSVMSSSLDQEKESPTSVLSLAASEIMSSRTYDATKQCISSDSSNSVPRASPGCEISCKSAHSQAEEANQGSSSGAQTSCNNQDVVVSKNGNSLKSFQLFGTLVVVEDRKSQPSPKDKSSIPASSRNPEDSLALGKTDRQVSAPKRAMKSIAAGSSTVPAGANSHCSCGLLPFFYPMPSQHGGATKQETAAPLTWLPLYSNPAFPPDQSFFGISLQDPDSETSGDKKEDASATGAKPEDCGSASSSHAEDAAGKKTPTQSPKARGFLPYKRRQAERDAKTTGPKWSSGDQKGFIPYKQCLMEREAMQQQSEDGGECREHQRVKLC